VCHSAFFSSSSLADEDNEAGARISGAASSGRLAIYSYTVLSFHIQIVYCTIYFGVSILLCQGQSIVKKANFCENSAARG
jgi:hypothetical protein